MEPLLKNWRTTYERIEKFISDTYFTDVNLHGRLYDKESPVNVFHLNKVTDPPKSCDGVPVLGDSTALLFEQVVAAGETDWTQVEKGFQFGKTWCIHWFRVDIDVHEEWADKKVHFLWDSGTEALVFSSSGAMVQGLNSTHHRHAIDLNSPPIACKEVGPLSLYLQVTCSDLFGCGHNGTIEPPNQEKTDFSIKKCAVGIFNSSVSDLVQDLKLLMGIAKELKETNRGYQALFVGNQIVNLASSHSPESYEKGRQLAASFFSQENGASQHTVHAMGHCHLDTAWLWRYTETRRKSARSWSSSLRLMEKYPEMTFVCSQAQQFAWLKEDYPDLFTQLVAMAKRGQFIPVGGTWVEMDANLPSCESFIRQFLYGQRFFKKEFGSHCKEFWLPDTFGYSAQLPQIMKLCNISRFVTQKMSWSLVNKFPHHTFYWRGLDGSKVLSHFPPGDSYCMDVEVGELLKTVNNFSDKGRSNSSLFLYGYGDGGQGPTEEMIMRLQRMKNCDGVPKVKMSSPDDYFSTVEREDSYRLCTWAGELYLELHNGTYTTHRQIKWLNLSAEWHLKQLELLDSLPQSVSAPKMCDEIEGLWKICLLNQFHDVLPGSSIEDVCDDAFYSLKDVVDKSIDASKTLIGSLTTSSKEFEVGGRIYVNPTSWPLVELVESKDSDGFVEVPSLGLTNERPKDASTTLFTRVAMTRDEKHGTITMENGHVRATVDLYGRLTSVVLLSDGGPRDAIKEGEVGGQLCLYDDVPLFWDAWDVMDYHMETRVPLHEAAGFQLSSPLTPVLVGDHRCRLECSYVHDPSGTTITQVIQLESHLPYVTFITRVPVWALNHKLLKVEFPLSIAPSSEALDAIWEVQGGHVRRPTHTNTSWEWSKFEVCSHRWLAVQEHGFGVALVKEAIHGGVVRDGVMHISLLRSPKSPDATADRKRAPHLFTYGLLPYRGSHQSAEVVRWAHQLAWRAIGGGGWSMSVDRPIRQWAAKVEPSSVVVLAVKKSCDFSDQRIYRFYESAGGQCQARVTFPIPPKTIFWTNCLEEKIPGPELSTNDDARTVAFTIGAFQIHSLAVTF